MKDLRLTITINKPIEEVFEFTTNPKNTPKWIDSIVEEQTNEWPVKLGTVYKNRGDSGEWSDYDIVAIEQDRTFTLRKKSDGYNVRYTFTPSDTGGTELEYYEWKVEGELDGPFTIEVLEKLKQIIETTPLDL